MTNSSNLSDPGRKERIRALEARLADTLILASQARQAYWNLKASDKDDLHRIFEQIHGEFSAYGDLIAKRLVKLGGYASCYSNNSSNRSGLTDYPLEAQSEDDHTKALMAALNQYKTRLKLTLTQMHTAGDEKSSSLIQDAIAISDKSLWAIEAYLE